MSLVPVWKNMVLRKLLHAQQQANKIYSDNDNNLMILYLSNSLLSQGIKIKIRQTCVCLRLHLLRYLPPNIFSRFIRNSLSIPCTFDRLLITQCFAANFRWKTDIWEQRTPPPRYNRRCRATSRANTSRPDVLTDSYPSHPSFIRNNPLPTQHPRANLPEENSSVASLHIST